MQDLSVKLYSLFVSRYHGADFKSAIAVGPNVFRPDSNTLVELLIRIQSILLLSLFYNFPFFNLLILESPIDPGDTQIAHYLIATWAKVCQAMGPEFEPYLPVVMPSLLLTASAKADLSVYGMCDGSYIGPVLMTSDVL